MADLLVIDTDCLIYKASSVAQKVIDWGEFVSMSFNKEEGIDIFMTLLNSITEELSSRNVVFCLGEGKNFRKELYPEYKSKRKADRRPIGYSFLRGWVKKTFDCKILQNVETDDVCGIEATKPENKSSSIIVSIDKDYKTIPCRLYNQDKKELITISPEEADDFHKIQTIAGDSIDGYPGIKGIGAVRAERFVKEYNYSWPRIFKLFNENGYDENYAMTMARMAFILRDGYYKNNRPVLWTPNI